MRFTMNTLFWILTVLVVSLSIFFTVNVVIFKHQLNASSKGLSIDSGQNVTVVKIVDGDEVSVKFNDKQFVVRILGIASFDPSIDDPSVGGAAREALNYLEKTLLNKSVTVVFDTFLQDKKNRLIAYLQLDGRDVGADMVDGGITLVYTKYPFSRMDDYLKRERTAMTARRGLWNDPIAANRSLQLKRTWEGK